LHEWARSQVVLDHKREAEAFVPGLLTGRAMEEGEEGREGDTEKGNEKWRGDGGGR